MTDDPPLNVQVARVLGWKRLRTTRLGWVGAMPDATHGWIEECPVPPYGADTPDGWACTGPLASELKMTLRSMRKGCDARTYIPGQYLKVETYAKGASIPEAIARLVVRLHEMAKLVKA